VAERVCVKRCMHGFSRLSYFLPDSHIDLDVTKHIELYSGKTKHRIITPLPAGQKASNTILCRRFLILVTGRAYPS